MDVEKVLKKYKIKPDLLLDQHFLADEKLVDELISLLELKKNDVVFEVGPGIGTFTTKIACKTIAVEIDHRLTKIVSENSKAQVILGNALEYITKTKFTKVLSSTPYSICEPLTNKLFLCEFELALLIVPESFAQKLIEKKTKLGLIACEFLQIKKIVEIPKTKFIPVPKTRSQALLLAKIEPNLSQHFLAQDDKKVKNALRQTMIYSGKTKRRSKELVTKSFKSALLEKKVNRLSLDDLSKILDFLRTI